MESNISNYEIPSSAFEFEGGTSLLMAIESDPESSISISISRKYKKKIQVPEFEVDALNRVLADLTLDGCFFLNVFGLTFLLGLSFASYFLEQTVEMALVDLQR